MPGSRSLWRWCGTGGSWRWGWSFRRARPGRCGRRRRSRLRRVWPVHCGRCSNRRCPTTRLRERLAYGIPDPARAYRQLAAWTSFWLDHRRPPGHELPYYEHGNDSGWDNSTVFRDDCLVQSADLAAFLVLQMKELATLAAELGEPSAQWTERAETLLTTMLTDLWDGTRFLSRDVASERSAPAPACST
ncbi:MGH1-like glycoside hydrolase domain-containing protein [Kibdelosporangium banguiense]|uniref:MGH1-like glycoside hydrolase domain-containing protein n=1 Tax=Kibdelosporangium banguiense TaxID=1365924 RepID=UPI003558818D